MKLNHMFISGAAALALQFAAASAFADQGITSNGTIYFDNEGWTGSWNFVCLADNCAPGALVNGRWERQVSGIVVGQTYSIQLKIQDNATGQYISDFFSVVAGDSTQADAGQPDTSVPDTSVPDAGEPDTSVADVGQPDTGSDTYGYDLARGVIWHVDPNPNALEGFHYGCVNSVCIPATLVNGRYERSLDGFSGSVTAYWQMDGVQPNPTPSYTFTIGTQPPVDAGQPDVSVPDTSVPDTSVPDTSVPDTSVPDTSIPDAGEPDTSVPDAAEPDVGPADSGAPDVGSDTYGYDPERAVIWHVDPNPNAQEGFHFGCLNNDCQPAELVNGRYERSAAGLSGTVTAHWQMDGVQPNPTPSYTFEGPGGSAGGGGGGGGGGCTGGGLDCLDTTTNSQPGNEVGPGPRTDRPDALPTPMNGATATRRGFAFDIEGNTLTWRWGPENYPEGTPGDVGYTRTAGDSGLEMYCSQDNNLTFQVATLSNGTLTIPCSGVYTYFFRYRHPRPLNFDSATAWIYTALFTTASRVDVTAYPSFTDGSANWMRWRHPIAHDGCTAAVSDACHNNSLLRHLDRYLIWFDDSPGNLVLNHSIEAGMKRVEAARHHNAPSNGQQQFTYNQDNGFGNEFSYGQVIQFEITSETPQTSQVYNDFSYYTVGLGWGNYGDPRLNSAGRAGTTMVFSQDVNDFNRNEFRAIFTQPMVTVHDEGLMNSFIVGHHLFHGIDPNVRLGPHDDVKIGDRTCGDCHFADGRGSEVIQTPRGPRLPPPVYGTKLLEAIPGQQGFGWNATQPTIADQTRAALIEDHNVNPDDMPPEALDAIIKYVEVLTVPNRTPGTYDDPDITLGEVAFNEVGCDDCHTPVQKTGTSGPSYTHNVTIRAYTDMRVWNVNGGNFRTPALWGLAHNMRVLRTAQRDILFLHDGSATSVEAAIMAHDGDAATSRDAFNSSPQRANIIKFVESL